MAASIYDVAKQAGVSISTVSRVLNGGPNVRPEKIEAVNQAVKRLNYTPNTLARGLATRTSGLIGITSSFNTYDSTYTLQMMKGFLHYIDATQHSVVLINDPGLPQNERHRLPPACLGHIEQGRIDALLYTSSGRPTEDDPCYRRIVEEGLPFAYIGRPAEGPQPPNVFALYAQMESYYMAVLERFAALGHRHVAIFYYAYFGHGRIMNDILHRAKKQLGGCVPHLYRLEVGKAATMRDAVDAMLADGCTALFGGALSEANALLGMLRARGIQVPRDLSLCGVEHVPGEGLAYGHGLDCVYVPAFDMGYGAARVLFGFMQGEEVPQSPILFEYEYMERGSVQPVE